MVLPIKFGSFIPNNARQAILHQKTGFDRKKITQFDPIFAP